MTITYMMSRQGKLILWSMDILGLKSVQAGGDFFKCLQKTHLSLDL